MGRKYKQFQRDSVLTNDSISCDCSGFINLLLEQLSVPQPYNLQRPKAVHYYAILQEIGGNQISQLKRGHLLAWRKDQLPKSGDTGHILLIWGDPERLSDTIYRVEVIDSTKAQGGLSKRFIELHTNELGQLKGVRLHEHEKKVKQCSIYHSAFQDIRSCFGCGMPKRVCLCDKIEANSKVVPNITILRHPGERKRTLSTVSLIKQRYPNVLVKDGEDFSPLRDQNLVCLYPDNEEISADSNITQLENGAGKEPKLDPVHYVLIDATWKKSKRMLHENQWLAKLPRFALKAKETSHYLIRKVPNPEALSTLECFALTVSDDDLVELFKSFMQMQLEIIGPERYRQNYGHYLNYVESV